MTLGVSTLTVQSAIKAHITWIMSSADLKQSRNLHQIAEIKDGHFMREKKAFYYFL